MLSNGAKLNSAERFRIVISQKHFSISLYIFSQTAEIYTLGNSLRSLDHLVQVPGPRILHGVQQQSLDKLFDEPRVVRIDERAVVRRVDWLLIINLLDIATPRELLFMMFPTG